MIRKTALVALVALLAVGMSAGALGATSFAASDAPAAQETTEDGEEMTEEQEETTEAGEETTTEGEEAATENATVTFENQTSNGSAVVVNETMLPEGGFVVIHLADNVTADSYDDPQNVSVGPVIGNSTYLEAGTHENVTVGLNRTVNESQNLVAMPHQDTDDNQLYEFPEADDPYTVDMLPVVDVGYVTVEGGEMMAEETTEEAGDEAAEETEEEEMAEETTEEEMDGEDDETTTEE